VSNKHPEYRDALNEYRQNQTDKVNENPDPREMK